VSTSLAEYTDLCRRITGKDVAIESDPVTNPLDVPLYLTDSSRAEKTFEWRPTIDARGIVEDIHDWIRVNESSLRSVFT
jgi:CDP-paratose 2-epimerase